MASLGQFVNNILIQTTAPTLDLAFHFFASEVEAA
jgi:hypothetical protein